MHNKTSNWLNLIERIIKLIRPHAYNTIAKCLIFTGVALIVESKVNIIHAIIVALFEKFIGESEILRQLLITSNSPSLGIFLISTGLFYHVIVTLGKDWIDTKKADLPKYPDLQLSFSSQKQVQQDNRLNLDGPLVILPPPDKIPIYEEDEKPVNHPSTSIFGSPIRSLTAGENHIRKSHTNTRLYKERVELLEEWAGFEPIKIQLTNFGQTIAKGLRVHLIIPKDNSLTLKQNDEKFPKKPEKYFISGIVMPVHDLNFLEFARLQAKMRIEDKNDHYELEWDIEKLQAGVVTSSNKVLLIKLTHPVDIKCTIFCDELPEPSNAIITLRPPEREVTINIEDIVNDQQFDELYQKYLSVFKQ